MIPVEPISTSIGLVGLFDACLSIYGRIGPMKDYSIDLHSLWQEYQLERTRFEVFRKALTDSTGKLSSNSKPNAVNDEIVYKFVQDNLESLIAAQENQIVKGNSLSEKHVAPRNNFTASTWRFWSKPWSQSSASGHPIPCIERPSVPKSSNGIRNIAWAVSDKPRLMETINYLRSCNDNLAVAVSHNSKATQKYEVAANLLCSIDDEIELQKWSEYSNPDHQYMSQGARLKKMQLASEKDYSTWETSTHRISLNTMTMLHKPDETTKLYSTARTYYRTVVSQETRPSPVVVEWRGIFQQATSDRDSEIRLNNIVEMLHNMSGVAFNSLSPSTAKQNAIDFRVLECLGWVKGTTSDPGQLGLVFRYPESARKHGMNVKVTTLRDRIEAYRQQNIYSAPSLGARFALATGLAGALGNLFLVNWVHRGLRSHNILFFSDSIDSPYLSGFTYSRPREEQQFSSASNEDPDFNRYRPANYDKLLLYYSQNSQKVSASSVPYTVGLDMYALGVILLEIAEWCTVGDMERREPGYPRSELIQKHVDGLGARVGEIYQGAVMLCLEEGVTDWKKKTPEEAMGVAVRVVEMLSKCEA